ncbi:DJ-1/PfpI family protein [Teichococcus oryzae]|uniref:DJ-1/PfpI family protein n=1 Tax=Teichococcus oryzae TaxID=1608942 RepID=UPI001F500C53|nr:DJ-1/PfpI family protein [Pseudoroseomonas oryzae]
MERPRSVDCAFDEVSEASYDALVLPGGLRSPDRLRSEPRVLALARDFIARRKTVAAWDHAGWILVDAGLATGRRMTSCAAIRTDLQNAGAIWLDVPLVQDQGVVTADSRHGLEGLVQLLVRMSCDVVQGRA